MAMVQAEFEAHVARMEAIAKERPRAYRRRVFALAALGYAYLVVVVVALLALSALAAYSVVYLKALGIKLLFIVGALLVVVLRALWVKFEPPEGERVTRAEAPALFALLDELRTRLRTPAVHEVVLTPEFNAAVMQLPRWGLFGGHRNFLLVGLPLMKGLSVEQFKAVLAHELGHLSRGHARASNWIYRLRRIWMQLEASFQTGAQYGAGAIRQFFKWYIPYFNATSFPLARANEYEADAASVQLTSARHAAQALTSVHVMGSFLDRKYWPAIQQRTRDEPEPVCSPFSGFVATSIHEVPASEVDQWQQLALTRTTTFADTHPALSDRLKAIGAPAEFVPPGAGEGAEQLLGRTLVRIEQRFDAQWRTRVAETWRRLHQETQKNSARLASLREQSALGPLDEEAGQELADLEAALGHGPEAALAMRRALLERFPDSHAARFALGRQLLTEDREEGVAIVEGLVAHDEGAVRAGAELLRDYFWRRGNMERARQWHQRYAERTELLRAAQAERAGFALTDKCMPHQLGAEQLAPLVAQLKKIADLKRVYLARKVLRHFPDEPLYLLGFRTTSFLRRHDHAREQTTLQAIRSGIEFPGPALIFSVEAKKYRFERRLRWMKGTRIV